MDEIVLRKLESLGRCIRRIEDHLPESMALLFRAQANAGTIDDALANSLQQAVGLRNLAVHDYSALDWKRLHHYLPQALDDLRAYSRAIVQSQ